MLATLWIPSCTPTENKKAAEEAVVDFHQKLNSARFREIYDSSDTEFKKAISEPDAVAYFNAVNGKLGLAKNSELKSWRVNFSANRRLVALEYQTEFAQGQASEEFIWNVDGDRAKLFRYNINSPTLVVK
jgi:hypothetical protein